MTTDQDVATAAGLRIAADEVHREVRFQIEMKLRGRPITDPVERLIDIEKALRFRAEQLVQ